MAFITPSASASSAARSSFRSSRRFRYLASNQSARVLAVIPLILAMPAAAEVVIGGDVGEVSPADPMAWPVLGPVTVADTLVQIGINAGKSGTVSIVNGGHADSRQARIGVDSGSNGSVAVAGLGSTWANSGAIEVGYAGSGALNIENAGVVTSKTASIGMYLGSSGTVTVTGPGSTWTTGSLQVGFAYPFVDMRYIPGGNGTLNVSDGGVVNAGSLFASPANLRGNGTINARGLVSDVDLVFDAVLPDWRSCLWPSALALWQ